MAGVLPKIDENEDYDGEEDEDENSNKYLQQNNEDSDLEEVGHPEDNQEPYN